METETTGKFKTTDEFKKMDIKTALELLKTSEKGISETDAAARVKEFGFNEVEQKKKSTVLAFLSWFWGPIPWFLEIAVAVTLLIGDLLDATILAAILLSNVIIGFYNEHDSQKALELLKHQVTIKAKVMRDGKWVAKEARELLPGDIILIGLGDLVPADAKIISGNISADQAAITGESLPVELKESDVLLTGSTIKRGEAKCVVVNTGKHTAIGRTVELVNIAKPKSKQEAIMFNVSKNLIYVGIVAFAIILIYALSIGTPIITILIFAVLFIAGGIPAALPVMFTISQAKGATNLSKHGILVTKLDSIENAASVEVLCLDKTGTITINKLEISEDFALQGFEKSELVSLAALASSAENKDSIDNCVLDYTKKNKADLSGYKQISYTPFEPTTKKAEAMIEFKGKQFKAVKGATQTLLSLCTSMDKKQKDEVTAKVEELSKKGCRVLAVGKSQGKGNKFVLAGLLALSNPLRPDTKETIAALKEAGIKPMMLTGDNIAVAREMAKQAGIGDKIVRISEIKKLPKSEQGKAIDDCNGIAEIFPEDKYWVVKQLQSTGKTVGMTGDGVNDAPALKQAELGIAVSNATDVAKAAASMVLTESGIKIILEGVRTSRRTYQRMLTWTLKKIALAIQFMIILAVGFFWFRDVIVVIPGLMLLLIMNDFMTMSLAVDNAKSTKNPNSWNVKNITIASVFVGVLLFVIELALLIWGANYLKLNFEQVRTLILLSLVFTGQFSLLIMRERGHFWNSWPARFVSITMWLAIIVFIPLSIFGIIITPLPASLVFITLAICIIGVLAIDFPKVWVFKKVGIS